MRLGAIGAVGAIGAMGARVRGVRGCEVRVRGCHSSHCSAIHRCAHAATETSPVGVPAWLAPEERRHSVSIGLLEAGDDASAPAPGTFDFFAVTEAAKRDDPCEELAKHKARGALR